MSGNQLVSHALDVVVMINPARSGTGGVCKKKKAPRLRHDGRGPRQGGADILLSDGAGVGVGAADGASGGGVGVGGEWRLRRDDDRADGGGEGSDGTSSSSTGVNSEFGAARRRVGEARQRRGG